MKRGAGPAWRQASNGVAGFALLACALLLFAAPAMAAHGKASFKAHGSMEQVDVTGADPGQRLSLIDASGATVQTRSAGELGGLIYRKVDPGNGYRVRDAHGAQTKVIRVLSDRSRPPSTKIYDQDITDRGYQYLKTRDGTSLAINVYPPTAATAADHGPWPTLIEYAGYGYADPSGGESSIQQVAGALGFAVVDVNMRGTGCSGGAFDFFEPAQGLDGYDVIETIARQPWVLHNKVGMFGISYGGISQLFVAETRPPDLSAIAPLSVLDQAQTTLFPGGILNTGFALQWAKDRVHDAEPAGPDGGQAWASEQIAAGDDVCKKNQELHTEAVNLLAKIDRNRFYKPKVADPLSPLTFVHKINVPTFMACQWTDEQTGGHCATLASAFTGTDQKWFTFTNGVHTDSLDPATFNRWYDFLELYVAQQKPTVNPVVLGAAPVIYQVALGIPGVTLPPDPIQQEPTFDSAKSAYEALPMVRVLFDNGAGGQPYYPYPGYERSFSSLPVKGTKALSYYLDSAGKLAKQAPTQGGADRFTLNPKARPATDFHGDTGGGTNGLWTASPAYDWTQNPAGTSVSYVTDPLAKDTTILGAGKVEAYVRSSQPDADFQATITEVRPDGKETFVQSGWVRGSERALDNKKSTDLEPVLSLRRKDVEPLPSDGFTKLTIPLYYEGHAYRAGSQIRVTISAVGGDQPIWAWKHAVPTKGTVQIDVAHSPDMPSRLVLPSIGGDIPTALPACPALRGEPCRDYEPHPNKSVSLK